ncbi:hypothetical protein KKH43_01615 [Patescibacteria group bacterium]|nr:hypothetical protein [Patescibacteria group bacterium]
MNPEHPSFTPPQEQEKLSNLEKWLSSELHKQYEETAKALNELGLLEILPECGEIGIVGTDGKEYPLPSEEQIKEEMLKNREVFETKMSQGFTELEITPFALPLERLIDVAKKTILKHYKEGKLFGTKENPDDESEPLELLKLDEDKPFLLWEGLKDADTQGTLIYYPEEFSKNHQGLTKQELLEASKDSSFSGFNVYLREKDINTPEKGKTQGGRTRLGSGKSSEGYLQALQTQQEYQQESGQTPEDWLTLFSTHLKKTNQVIDEYHVSAKYNRLIGSYHPASKGVPIAGWNNNDRQAFLYRSNLGHSFLSFGARSAVRIPPLEG